MSGYNSHLTINTSADFFYDPRTYGYQQRPLRTARLQRACTNGGGAISKSPDGTRCVVTGKESLKILRMVDPLQTNDLEDTMQYKTSAIGRGGFRIEASRNLWDGSGLKIDSSSTCVAWCREEYKRKILTSARNGELIMWDINKSGSKYERKSKDHIRSIHALSISPVVSNYCITGSSDGDLRVWDLREFQKSIMRVRHPTGIRSIVFSPVVWSPLQAVVGLENGSIHRWDLKMGQRGSLDRIMVAHSASVTSLDWCSTSTAISASGAPTSETSGNGYGWIVSGGLDRCVKVWDLTSVSNNKSSHMPHNPKYTLHPSFQVRRVLWRPSHECEVAVLSNGEFSSGSNPDIGPSTAPSVLPKSAGAPVRTPSMRSIQGNQGMVNKIGTGLSFSLEMLGNEDHHIDARGKTERSSNAATGSPKGSSTNNGGVGDAAEIWDVRRGWIAKWRVNGSAAEGGSTDLAFGDSNTLWTQHSSGMFSQLDLRDATKPDDAIPRVSLTADASGSLTFVSSSTSRWEVPYDDIRPETLKQATKSGIKQKGIGDPVFRNTSQITGTLDGLEFDSLQTFVQLARTYVIEGDDRQKICTSNAQIAFEAGHLEAAQIWTLVAASLTNIVPNPPSRPPPKNNMIHSVSSPAVVSYGPDNGSSPGSRSARGSEKASSIYNNQLYTRSLSRASGQRRRPTPSSSNNTSPYHGLTSLPPMTPMTGRLPSYLGRRESIDSGINGVPGITSRRHSLYRRPSTSYSASPSSLSLKHVGEGALDDSDSSSSSEGEANNNGSKDSSIFDDDHEELDIRRTHLSPAIATSRISHPSPLSRVAGQHRWKGKDEEGQDEENDDDEASASPRSTDSEASNGVNTSLTRAATFSSRRSLRRSSTSLTAKKVPKARSQSATLYHASVSSATTSSNSRLSVSSSQPKPLVRQDSRSSIRTVIAGDTSYRGDQNGGISSLKAEETIKDLRSGYVQQRKEESPMSSKMIKRQMSGVVPPSNPVVWTQRHGDLVEKEERRMINIVWAAVYQKLEDMADNGDVQMCAMLAILIPKELSLRKQQQLMFIEGYIERLTRLQLFTCASYIRKHVPVEDIQKPSLVETVIYSSCGRCRKAFICTSKSSVTGEYSYCTNCRASVTCSICRLPVRGIMFYCSICSHGGHQLCYRRFYMARPMEDVPFHDLTSHSKQAQGATWSAMFGSTASTASNAGTDDESMSTTSTSVQDTSSETGVEPSTRSRLLGHPCVVPLCGHHCWISNIKENKEVRTLE
ncbi:hypothetical protein J3R30DRAFT_310066 [Lentinula aciculospora]|uniref:WD40 repeat-like protein n=1 Tax=Lentinula aciculospora TaxID=153920 RepID=A0A9W9A834_9AGAR|nr:hypothetical protein J3R30DRAFT_310066 [Lentinula aciculospora]